MWQKCPVCDGTGITQNYVTTAIISSQCTVCRGQKIIYELTGLPPSFPERDNPLINAARGRDECGINLDELKNLNKKQS